MSDQAVMSERSRPILRPLGILVLALLLAACDALISPQHRLARARAELDAGEWGRAAIELRKLVQTDPQNAQAWLLLARWSLDVGHAGDARSALDRAMKARASARELDELRVRMWLETGQPKEVIDAAAHNALALPEPDRSVALAHAYNQLRRYDRTIALLQPLLAAHPNSTDARLAAVVALWRSGKANLALRTLDAAMADRSSWAAPLLKGQLAQRQGRLAIAEDAFALAIQRMPPSAPMPQRVEALANLTEVRLAQSKVKEASESEARLVKLAPDWLRTQLLRGRLEIAGSDYVNGIADLERVVAHGSNYGEARMFLATAQVQRGSLEQAQSNLEELVHQSPDNVPARKLLAQVRLKLNEPEDALSALTPALGAKLMDAQLYALLSTIENQIGNPNSVLDALGRSLSAQPDNPTLRLNLAQAYLSANQPKEALQVLEAAPDRVDDPQRDALLIAAIGEVRGTAAADAEVEKLLAAHPHDPAVLNLAASFFLSHAQADRARALLRQALAANPRDVSSLVNLARLDAATGDAQGAESALREALDQDRSNLRIRMGLADLLMQRKAFTEAQQLIEAANNPGSPDVQFALARVALARGDLKQANAALDRAVALRSGSAELENQAGLLLLAARQYEPALARFRQATGRVADNAVFWFNTARAQVALNQAVAARQSLEKANTLQPEWVAPVSALSVLDVKAKNYQTALERVKVLVAKQPNDPDALVLEGDVDESVGRYGDAATAYAEAQQRRPDAAVLVRLFEARHRAGTPKPEQPLQQWLAENPNDFAVRRVLGAYYLGERDLKQAAREFEAVLAQSPNDIVALNDLAWVYQGLQDARAEEVAEHAYKLAPTAPAVDDTLGWILARKHATDRALALLTQAARAGAGDPDIQYHYAYALAAAGKRAEAREILSKVLAGKQDFDSRRDAERLLANLKA
jgi:cellulose synthase operon protein C